MTDAPEQAESDTNPSPEGETPAVPAPEGKPSAKPTPEAEPSAKPTPEAEASAKPTPEAEPSAKPTPEAEASAKPTPEPRQPEGPEGKCYFWGTGRRKRGIARVRVRPGSGSFKVNGRDHDDYFRKPKDRGDILKPLEATGTLKKLDIFVNVIGGGTTGQAGAIVLGIARALMACDPDYEPMLRERNFLSRDPRKVERKKYGQRGARRRFQFSKR